jgi:hypothetical protein
MHLSRRRALRTAAVAFVAALLASAHVAGQASSSQAKPRSTAPGAWTAPRTANGQPDLQGIWSFATVTPLERPRELADKETLTEEEAVAYAKRQVELQNKDNRSRAAALDVETAYNDFWWDSGTRVIGTRRTSLVIDPPDGRIPPLTAEAQARIKAPRQRPVRERVVIGGPAEGPEDLGLSERCIIGFNSGPPILPSAYNNNLQIFQSPGHVAIHTEMVHEARIVPLDGRPHLPQNVRQWLGDSRGRWEGNTLVVETTNFTDKSAFSGNLIMRGGASDQMRLVERFTRVSRDMLLYEFTVTDPTTWTRPWTAQVPMTRSEEKMFEYACHEGNYGMRNLLAGARAQEKAAAERPPAQRR